MPKPAQAVREASSSDATDTSPIDPIAEATSALPTAVNLSEEPATPDPATQTDEDSNTDPEAKPATLQLVADPFAYGRTVVTLTYTFLPEDGHPDGRAVLIGLSTMGQEPLFSEALRERSEALAIAVTALQEQYKLYLPDRKVEVELAAAAAKQAAVLKSASKTTLKSTVPAKHTQPLQGGSEAVVVSERRLNLFA